MQCEITAHTQVCQWELLKKEMMLCPVVKWGLDSMWMRCLVCSLAWDLTGLLSKYVNIHLCGIKVDAFDCLKRDKVELCIAGVSFCPRPCPSPIASVVWECALVWVQGGRCYPRHSVFLLISTSLCKHNTNIKLLFVLFCLLSVCLHNADKLLLAQLLSLQGYSGDVSDRSLLRHMDENSEWSPLSQNAEAFHLVLLYLIKINAPRGLSNCWMFKK